MTVHRKESSTKFRRCTLETSSEGASWSPVAKTVWRKKDIGIGVSFQLKCDQLITYLNGLMVLIMVLSTKMSLTALEASSKSSIRSSRQSCYLLLLLFFYSVIIRIWRHLRIHNKLSWTMTSCTSTLIWGTSRRAAGMSSGRPTEDPLLSSSLSRASGHPFILIIKRKFSVRELPHSRCH